MGLGTHVLNRYLIVFLSLTHFIVVAPSPSSIVVHLILFVTLVGLYLLLESGELVVVVDDLKVILIEVVVIELLHPLGPFLLLVLLALLSLLLLLLGELPASILIGVGISEGHASVEAVFPLIVLVSDEAVVELVHFVGLFGVRALLPLEEPVFLPGSIPTFLHLTYNL